MVEGITRGGTVMRQEEVLMALRENGCPMTARDILEYIRPDTPEWDRVHAAELVYGTCIKMLKWGEIKKTKIDNRNYWEVI